MAAVADVDLVPDGMTAWAVLVAVGLVAGFLTARVMRGSGYGLAGGVTIGLLGAVVGGLLFGTLAPGIYATAGLAGSIAVALLGACLLIWVARGFAPSGPPPGPVAPVAQHPPAGGARPGPDPGRQEDVT